MHRPTFCQRLWLLSATIAALVLSGGASAEPPSRVARLSDIDGTVSFSPAGQPDWTQAMVNRPLTTGDRLWSDAKSRAEVQLGGAAIRLGAATSMTVLKLDDRSVQLQLAQGTLLLRVRRMRADQVFVVDTPNLALTLRYPGEYRVSVDPGDDATAVSVRSGDAEVHSQGVSYSVNADQGYRFYGTGLSDYDLLTPRRDDDLDRWAHERDRRSDNSTSARFVSPEVVGYEDLDEHGSWRADPDYGNVWIPAHVDAGWTPYHDGHWAWVDPWGWTWVDDAPWGYAVSHYGRWANIRGAWGWVPGPPREPAVYAPALVAFVGGRNSQLSLSIGRPAAAVVGWFPLAPRDVYQPPYAVSRDYFEHINRSNAVIAPTTIDKVYNTTVNNINVTKVVYANQQVTGAVVAVPAQSFAQSQPVAKAVLPISREALSVAPIATIAPAPQGAPGGAHGARPPAGEQAVAVHVAPPPFAKPATPIDEAPRQPPRPAALPSPAARPPEARQADAVRLDSVNSGVAKRETAKPDAARVDAPKAETTRPAAATAARSEAAAPPPAQAAARPQEARQADTLRLDSAKAEGARREPSKIEGVKPDAARIDPPKAEAVRPPPHVDAARNAAARPEVARPDAARAEPARAAPGKVEAPRAVPAQAEAARPAPRAEAPRGGAAKSDEERKKAEEEARKR